MSTNFDSAREALRTTNDLLRARATSRVATLGSTSLALLLAAGCSSSSSTPGSGELPTTVPDTVMEGSTAGSDSGAVPAPAAPGGGDVVPGGLGAGGSSGGAGAVATGGEGDAAVPTAPNCVPNGKARNPIVSHIFTADPSAKVFGDRVYVYTSHDVDGQTNFDMTDYHAFSSDDLVNWRDHGVIITTADLSWAANLYAPDACEKDGKYYLYMPNSGSGIGVAVADDPGGPFVDPLGRPLVTPNTPGAQDVDWLFDPACFVDEDGQGYLYFGGGPENTGDNARVIRLGADMISLADASATTIVAPAFFEAAFMHKRGGTYYFSYSTNFVGHSAYLDYMTSDDPMGGFQYRGTILTNGAINNNNNNHGSIVELAGRSYLFYHTRKLEQDGGGNNSFQRSVSVQELTYDENGSIAQLAMTPAPTTVDQLKCLDGLTTIEAETIAAQRGIEVEGNGAVGVSVTAIDDGDWIGYSQVDFGAGVVTFNARVAAAAAGGAIEVRIDGCDDFTSEPGSVIGTCEVPSTGGAQTWLELSCPVTETSGAHDLCLRFTGSSTFNLDSFRFE